MTEASVAKGHRRERRKAASGMTKRCVLSLSLSFGGARESRF